MKTTGIIASIVIMVASLLLIFFTVLPKYNELTALQEDLIKKETEFKNRSVYYENILKSLRDVEKRKDAVDKVNVALPEDFYLAPIVYFMEDRGSRAGMSVKSVSFSKSMQLEGSNASLQSAVKSVALTLVLLGDYQSFKNFLDSLEKSARLFEVENVNLAPSPQSTDLDEENKFRSKKYTFRLDVRTNTY